MNIKICLNEAINYDKYKTLISKDTFEELLKLDPTSEFNLNKGSKFSVWIVENYLKYIKKNHNKNVMDFINSYTELKKNLYTYDKYRNKKVFPVKYKNIMDFPSIEFFMNFINENLPEIIKESNFIEALKDSNVLYRDEDKILLIPKSKFSSFIFGGTTEWCTSREFSDSYYNQYSREGTIFIYAKKIEGGDYPYSGYIQLFIPHEENEILGECRDSNDKTIYGAKLFTDFPEDIIQKLEEKWDSIPNTDQWPEGRGYLDPTILHPEDEDEDENEPEIITTNHLFIDGGTEEETHEFNYTIGVEEEEMISENGDYAYSNYTTLTSFESEGDFYNGKEFFTYDNEIGMNIIKKLIEFTNKEYSDNYLNEIPRLDIENCLVLVYKNDTLPPSICIKHIDRDYRYDDSDDSTDDLLTYSQINSKYLTVIQIYPSDERYSINWEEEFCIPHVIFHNIEYEEVFEFEDKTIHIVTFRRYNVENLRSKDDKLELLVDSKLYKYILGEIDFIRNDDIESKYGQQFLQFEKAYLNKLITKLEERKRKRRIKSKLGRPSEPGRLFIKNVTSLESSKE